MGIAVELIKKNQTADHVSYLYRSAGSNSEFGEVKLNLNTGEVFLEVLAPDDESEALARRASWSLFRCFRDGEFPEKTWWQS